MECSVNDPLYFGHVNICTQARALIPTHTHLSQSTLGKHGSGAQHSISPSASFMSSSSCGPERSLAEQQAPILAARTWALCLINALGGAGAVAQTAREMSVRCAPINARRPPGLEPTFGFCACCAAEHFNAQTLSHDEASFICVEPGGLRRNCGPLQMHRRSRGHV